MIIKWYDQSTGLLSGLLCPLHCSTALAKQTTFILLSTTQHCRAKNLIHNDVVLASETLLCMPIETLPFMAQIEQRLCSIWKRKNISADITEQKVMSAFLKISKRALGGYHQTLSCHIWKLDLRPYIDVLSIFGFV